MPSSSVVLKSSPATKPCAQSRIPSPGSSFETAITATDSAAPIKVSPIVCGSRRKRAFKTLSVAASTMTIAAASKGDSGILLQVEPGRLRAHQA